jgi:copper chaperone CopZ
MKIFKTIILITILLIGIQSKAQEITYQKESFKVWGICEMCKTTIDKAAGAIEGVKRASWTLSTKKINVKYDIDKTSVDSIQKALALAGYDSEKYKATDEGYNNLHKCCKYDRK